MDCPHCNASDRGADGSPRLRTYLQKINLKSLSDKVSKFRQRLANRDLDFREDAAALYQLLIAPAAEQLRGKQTIVISPDGPLWNLLFQALEDSGQRYLIEDHSLFFAPSLTVLRQMRNGKNRVHDAAHPPKLFAMGNPSVDKIPNAAREIRALASLYGSALSSTYMEAEAREEIAKSQMPNFDVVHFATHGVFDDHRPMYSYLVLSPPRENGEDWAGFVMVGQGF